MEFLAQLYIQKQQQQRKEEVEREEGTGRKMDIFTYGV